MSNSVDPSEATPRLIPINVSKTIFVTYPPPPLIVDWVNKKITQPGSLLNKKSPKEPTNRINKNKTDVNTPNSSGSVNVKSKIARTSSNECFERTFIIEQDKSTKTGISNGREMILSPIVKEQNSKNKRKKPLFPSKSKEKSCVRKKPSKTATSIKEETKKNASKSNRQVIKLKTTQALSSKSATLSADESERDTVKTTRRTARMKTCTPISSTTKLVPLEDNSNKEVKKLPSRRTSKKEACLSNTCDRTVVSEKGTVGSSVVNSIRRVPRMKTCLPATISRSVVPLQDDAKKNNSCVRSTGFRSCSLDKSSRTAPLNKNTSVDNNFKTNSTRAPRMRTCVPSLPSRTIVPLKGSEHCEAKPNRVAPRMRSCVARVPSRVSIQSENESRKGELKSKRIVPRMRTCVPTTPSRILIPSDNKQGPKYKSVVPRMRTCIPSMPSRVVIPLKEEAKKNSKLNRGSMRMKSCIPSVKDRIIVSHGSLEKPN